MAVIPHSYETEDDQRYETKNGDETENEECAPVKSGCGQPYTSNHASCPSSTGNDNSNPNKSRGPAEQDQQASTELSDGGRDTHTPSREEPGTAACHDNLHVNHLSVGRNDRSSDIVPNGGAPQTMEIRPPSCQTMELQLRLDLTTLRLPLLTSAERQ